MLSVTADSPPSSADVAKFPFKFGSSTLAGRKHSSYSNKEIIINEDLLDTFTFFLTTSNTSHLASCFYLADGHGETPEVPNNKRGVTWEGSKAEKFMKLFQKTIKSFLPEYLQNSLRRLNFDDFVDCITDALENLHAVLDQHLVEADQTGTLLQENGCTLTLALIFMGRIWFCNIGDSSMQVVDKETGEPLRIWQREGLDQICHICSYEDTLASWPISVHEGQTHAAVKRDFDQVMNYLRKGMGRNSTHKIIAPKSLYGLGMTNTVGNLNHKGRLVGLNGKGRTTVYSHSIQQLLSHSQSKKSATIIFCSDGVKDVLTTHQISKVLHNLEHGLFSLAGFPPSTDKSIQEIIDAIYQGYTKDKHDHRARATLLELILKQEELGGELGLDDICEALTHLAVSKKSYDDVSVIAVELVASDECISTTGFGNVLESDDEDESSLKRKSGLKNGDNDEESDVDDCGHITHVRKKSNTATITTTETTTTTEICKECKFASCACIIMTHTKPTVIEICYAIEPMEISPKLSPTQARIDTLLAAISSPSSPDLMNISSTSHESGNVEVVSSFSTTVEINKNEVEKIGLSDLTVISTPTVRNEGVAKLDECTTLMVIHHNEEEIIGCENETTNTSTILENKRLSYDSNEITETNVEKSPSFTTNEWNEVAQEQEIIAPSFLSESLSTSLYIKPTNPIPEPSLLTAKITELEGYGLDTKPIEAVSIKDENEEDKLVLNNEENGIEVFQVEKAIESALESENKPQHTQSKLIALLEKHSEDCIIEQQNLDDEQVCIYR